MSDWREIAYEAARDFGNEYGGKDSDTEIARLRARICELEERLHERDLAVAELARQCDEMRASLAAQDASMKRLPASRSQPGAAQEGADK